MHKIDAPNATAGNEFTDGDPASGIEATELIAKWHNTIQRELVAVCAAGGIDLDDANDGQVLQALQAIMTAFSGQQIKQKKIDIGEWDMQALGLKSGIAHEIDSTKLIGIREVQILSDDGIGAGRWPLSKADSSTGAVDGYFYISASGISIGRRSGGFFDNNSFNQTGINRGFIVVDYLA